MWVPLERLLVGLRQVPSRTDELVALRQRVRAIRTTAAEREAAAAVTLAKQAVLDAIGQVSACATCASSKPAPRGVFAGGDCCSSPTEGLFADDEIAMLVASGMRVHDLIAPRDAHAGCAFRGATGCTLGAAHRPERCTRYVCGTLKRELIDRGGFTDIEDKLGELQRAMAAFVAVRRAAQDAAAVATLEAELSREARTRSRAPRRE